MSRAAELADRFIAQVAGSGRTAPKGKVEAVLTDEVSATYRPSVPWLGDTYDILSAWWRFYFDVPAMLLHPSVFVPLSIVKAPVAVAEFQIKGSSPEIQAFAESQVHFFWDKCLREVEETARPYGWAGGEVVYADNGKNLCLKEYRGAAARDVSPLTFAGRRVGVRMKNVHAGSVDLWLGSENVPAKGFWYRHHPSPGTHYGRAQLLTAHRPWQRLAGRDGAEELADLGMYRFAIGNWLIRYPNEEVKSKNEGGTRRSSRDVARELGESLKTGASVEVPSTRYPAEQGHEFKWSIEHIAPNVKLEELGQREDRLAKQCGEAILSGSMELLQAAETGSGFSGRMIPLAVFLLGCQKDADSLLAAFVENVLRPLVRWNYGPRAWVEASVKPLLETFRRLFAQQPAGVAGGGFGGPTGNLPGVPGGGQSTLGNVAPDEQGNPNVGRPTPEQVMAAVLQAQQEATAKGDPHANDAEIHQLLDLLPGRQKEQVKDGYVGGVSRRHHMKAIGVGQNAGRIVYGQNAKRVLSKQGGAGTVKHALGDDTWVEAEHPRDDIGRWVEKGLRLTDRFNRDIDRLHRRRVGGEHEDQIAHEAMVAYDRHQGEVGKLVRGLWHQVRAQILAEHQNSPLQKYLHSQLSASRGGVEEVVESYLGHADDRSLVPVQNTEDKVGRDWSRKYLQARMQYLLDWITHSPNFFRWLMQDPAKRGPAPEPPAFKSPKLLGSDDGPDVKSALGDVAPDDYTDLPEDAQPEQLATLGDQDSPREFAREIARALAERPPATVHVTTPAPNFPPINITNPIAVHVPRQDAPAVHVEPTPVRVDVNPPAVHNHIPPAERPEVTVNVAAAKAPDVTVRPEIRVEVPAQPPAAVVVQVPDRKPVAFKIRHDDGTESEVRPEGGE